MATQAQASNAGSASADAGVDAGAPAQQLDDRDAPPDVEETAVDIPEEDRQRIIDAFSGEPETDSDDESDDDGDGGEDDLDDGDGDDDLTDEERLERALDEDDDADGGDTDPDGDGQPGDEDGTLSDDTLDEIEGTLRDKQKQAFIHMRKGLKEKDARVEELEVAGEFGQRLHGILEQHGIDEDGFERVLDMVAAMDRDPLSAIGMLKQRMADVAGRAKEMYPDFGDKIDQMVEGVVAGGGEEELPPDLQEAVELGTITIDRAKQLAKLERASQQSQDDGTPSASAKPESGPPTATEKAEMQALHRDLHKLGYYAGTEREVEARTNEVLIPRAEEIAQEFGIELGSAPPNIRRKVLVKAAREIVKTLEPEKASRRQGRQLRSRDGDRPKPRQRGEYKDWNDMKKGVLSAFKS